MYEADLRRRWSEEEKQAIIDIKTSPTPGVSEDSRRRHTIEIVLASGGHTDMRAGMNGLTLKRQ